MAQITGKELTALGDLLNAEQLMVAKYRFAAGRTEDAALADCCNRMAQRHQRHVDELYANLK